jgi:large subunit ribosomal protein L17
MRHYKKGRKLGSDASHTKAIKKNLMVALFTNDRIKTTLERAKEVRGDVDRLITWAKRGDVHSRRLAIAKLGDKHLVAELFAKVEQGMYEGRPGGYTRILRLGKRRGDAAVIVILELVQEPVGKKTANASDKAEKAAPAGQKKPTAKADAADATDDAAKGDVDVDEVVDEAVDEVIDDEPVEASVESEEPAAEDTVEVDADADALRRGDLQSSADEQSSSPQEGDEPEAPNTPDVSEPEPSPEPTDGAAPDAAPVEDAAPEAPAEDK